MLALFPLAMHGGPLWQPLCYAQIGGLTVATFITLLMVPVLYSIFVLDLKILTWDEKKDPSRSSAPPAAQPQLTIRDIGEQPDSSPTYNIVIPTKDFSPHGGDLRSCARQELLLLALCQGTSLLVPIRHLFGFDLSRLQPATDRSERLFPQPVKPCPSKRRRPSKNPALSPWKNCRHDASYNGR